MVSSPAILALRRRVRVACLVIALLVIALAEPALAQESGKTRLRVGTKLAPPFVMKDEDGKWSGISVEFWRALADELGVTWEFQERRLPELFAGLTDGSLDVALSALTITAEREKQVDFTHPYFQSGLGIAVSRRSESGWWAVARRLASADVLQVLGLLLLLLFGTGVLVWLFERRNNHEQFGGGLARGLGSGFWWSAVTMTTVGYGDKAPRTLAGRLVGFVWMFACVVFLSGLTATIASALTVSRLEYAVSGPRDLPRVRVATVSGTTSEAYLKSRRIASTAVPTVADALEALAAGTVQAVVYDKPLLEWTVNGQYADRLFVLPVSFRPESYAIALPAGSDLKERLNVLIPEVTSADQWSDIVFRHLRR